MSHTAEFRENVNEMGEAPVLVHGTKKLSQSGVILTYLAERSGKFLPRGDDERLEALRWIIFDNQKIAGALGPYRFLRNFGKKCLPLKHVRLGSITGISDVIGAFGRCEALEERRRMPALPGGSTVRSAALRSSVLNLAKTCSIGLRSGL